MVNIEEVPSQQIDLKKIGNTLGIGKSKIGITRKNKTITKKKRKMIEKSTKANRLKKRHHKTRKEKRFR
jgi:uncharacterized protein (UPF0254 family)